MIVYHHTARASQTPPRLTGTRFRLGLSGNIHCVVRFRPASRRACISLFEVGVPCRIKGICLPFDLDVPSDGYFGCATEGVPHRRLRPLFMTKEDPIVTADRGEVFVLHPSAVFFWVPSFFPSPPPPLYCPVHPSKNS